MPLFCAMLLIFFLLGEKLLIERQGRDFLEPDLVFFIIFFIFHFSYIALLYLGLAAYDKEVFYNPDIVPRALYFCIFCLIGFLVGYGRPVGFPRKLEPKDIRYFVEKAFFFSKILLILCLLFFWIPLLITGNEVFYDYKLLIAVGEASSLGKLFWLGQYLGVAAIALFCVSGGILYRKCMKGPFKYLAIFYIGSFLIIGDRGGFVYMAITPMLVFNLFQTKLSGKKLTAILLLFLLIIPIIAFARTKSIFNPIQMVRTYSENDPESFVVSSLSELGSTLKTVVIAMYLIPERYNYWNGSSYLYSFSLILPKISGKRSSSGSPGAWLTEMTFGDLSKTHGRGGSIAMEAYQNFGFIVGILFFLFLGYTLKKTYVYFLRNTTILAGVLYFSAMACFALWIRNTSAVTFRTIAWSFLIVYFFRKIVLIGYKRTTLRRSAK